MPLQKDVVRVKTYINVVMISQDQDNFYFTTLNQVDFKVIAYSFFNPIFIIYQLLLMINKFNLLRCLCLKIY